MLKTFVIWMSLSIIAELIDLEILKTKVVQNENHHLDILIEFC